MSRPSYPNQDTDHENDTDCDAATFELAMNIGVDIPPMNCHGSNDHIDSTDDDEIE